MATRVDACAGAYPKEQVAQGSSPHALLRANPFSEAKGDTEAPPSHPLEPEHREQRSEIRADPLNRLERKKPSRDTKFPGQAAGTSAQIQAAPGIPTR